MSSTKGKLRLAVLISGSGTNLQALLDRSADGELNAEVVVVVSDRSDAPGLARALHAHVPCHAVDYSHENPIPGHDAGLISPDLEELDAAQRIIKIPDRSRRMERLRRLVLSEQHLIEILDNYQPDYICLAGYMRLLSPYFIRHYNVDDKWRILNIHPALLPAFPGQHGYEDTFAYGCKWGGITVHFVDEGEDSGPIIAQAVYPILPDEDVEKVRQRGLQLEYEIYFQCINWLAADQITLRRMMNGRTCVSITDPSYLDILKNWVRKAFV